MSPNPIVEYIIAAVLICIALKLYIGLYQDRKVQNSLLEIDHLETSDLRISSLSYRSFFISFGNKFDYLKFHFTENEVFVFMRNSFPGYYSGPFLIKEKVPNKYSYLGKLDLTRFSVTGQDIHVSFGHQNLIGIKYNIHLTNVNDEDMAILIKYLN